MQHPSAEDAIFDNKCKFSVDETLPATIWIQDELNAQMLQLILVFIINLSDF